MSFNNKLFSMDSLMPKQKKRKNGNGKNGKKRNGNGNGSAKSAARGFEAPGFFGGLQNGGGAPGIPKTDDRIFDRGLQIPELGEGFNSRFGKVGSGFVENVDTFKVGFSDVLTGNGRSGEIIGSGGKIGARGRGRPRGSGKGGRRVATKTTTAKKSGKTVGSLLAGAASKGIKGGITRLKSRGGGTAQFSTEEIQAEKTVDRANVQGLQAGLQKEIEEQEIDMTDEEVEEEDETVLDKEMSDEEGVNGK